MLVLPKGVADGHKSHLAQMERNPCDKQCPVLGWEKGPKEQPDPYVTILPSLKQQRMGQKAKAGKEGRWSSEFIAKGRLENIWKE